ncbi:hypothetical protein [Frisingicoccus sp.]|uniref:hypothetical protein n=1 Tax=Frisingicoccus sp. TaxID=1918627 RepID=UPI00399C3266
MSDYKVKITPELDSGKFQKELKNLTRDRTMKIKLDTSGLEKAARLAEKLNTKQTSAFGPKAPNLSDYSQTVKDINALVDAQNRLQSAIIRTGNISLPAISGPSEADLNRIREASKAYEELCTSVQKYNEISATTPAGPGTGRATTQQTTSASADSSSPISRLKSVLVGGMSALNTFSKVKSTYYDALDLSEIVKQNLDQPKFLAATLL